MDSQLIPYFAELLWCRECHLPKGYWPQIRPPGPEYESGGVVFAQINPGHIGRLSEAEIQGRYKTVSRRSIARRKRADTREVLRLQREFQQEPSQARFELLRKRYLQSMSSVWGWPPGKYGRTIEQHGCRLEAVAVVNIAQCPIPNDKYGPKHLDACWSKWTYGLLEILQPSLVVAQGATVYRFLAGDEALPKNVRLELGVHHASRQSRELKARQFEKVKRLTRRISG